MSIEAADWPDDRIRIARIIARLNIGGPAIQAITLTACLEQRGYSTTLVRGQEGPDEGSMDDLAHELAVAPVLVRWLRRDPGRHDLAALAALTALMRREHPQIVHTHAAKAGTLGRLAALIAFPRRRSRPLLVHTYHGHSLTGYFSPRVASVYRLIERVLGRCTDRLIAVSEEVRDELVELGVAPKSEFEVIRLGFDLSAFAVDGDSRGRARNALRAELGIPPDARVVTLIARLVPIKRVDRFLQLAASLRDLSDVRFLIVGDGELREQLQRAAIASELHDRLVWAGFRRDMPAVYFASDLVVQTSDNEGTPVSLIEAQAAGLPVVSTRVGGAASVMRPHTGCLVERDDHEGLTAAVRELLGDADRARQMGQAAAEHARARFDLAHLIDELDGVYRDLLRRRGMPHAASVRSRSCHHPSRRRNTSSVSSSHSSWP